MNNFTRKEGVVKGLDVGTERSEIKIEPSYGSSGTFVPNTYVNDEKIETLEKIVKKQAQLIKALDQKIKNLTNS